MSDVASRSGRFWLRPKWVIGHVLVIVLVVAFANFGFWQLRRLDERRDANAVIAARSSVAVQPLEDVVTATTGFDEVGALAYRRVTARGTYDADASVLVRSRALEGRPGFHVLTPLVVDGGEAVMVNRGFAPFTTEPAEVFAATRPPTGVVEVSGLVLGTQERQGIGPTDPAGGDLSEIARVDLARLQQQSEVDLYPVYLQLQEQTPAAGDLPAALPAPEQTEGNHLSYAGQWFLFAVVGVVGWPLLLRHTAREGEGAGQPGIVVPAATGSGRRPVSDQDADRVPATPASRS